MNPKTQRNILVGIVLLLLFGAGYLYYQYKEKSNQLSISEQNRSALRDSVKKVETKKEEIEFTKNILVSKKNKLEELNEDLNDELEETKGKVRQLNKVVAEVSNKSSKDGEKDTIVTENEIEELDSNTYSLNWKVDTAYNEDSGLLIKGNSRFEADIYDDALKIKPLKTRITDYKLRMDLVSGLREKSDGKVEMFVRSSHPGFEAKEIHSSIIDPQKHPALKKFTTQDKWGVGPQVGIGVGSNLNFTPYIGIGLQYNVITF